MKARTYLEQDMNLQDLPGEMWKPITDFEGEYVISNYGRVKSLERIVLNGTRYRKVKPLIRKCRYSNTFCQCELCRTENGIKFKRSLNIVREMAIQFNVPNPHNYKNAILKDGNVNNLTLDNIEWSEFKIASGYKPCVNVETGEEYKSLSHLARKIGRKQSTVSNAIKRSGSVNGVLANFTDWDRDDVLLPSGRNWKHITYKGINFIISDMGDIVKDAIRKPYSNGIIQYFKPVVVKPHILNGKLRMTVRNKPDKRVIITPKMLVAEAWVPNPNKYKYVKQIDGDIYNLQASNLEWVVSTQAAQIS